MKNLNKFFIISLLSFIFLISNVKAEVSDTYTQIFYSDSNATLINQYSAEIEAIKTYIAQNGVRTSGSYTAKYITGGQYAVIFKTDTFSSGTIVAGLGNITGNFQNYYSQYGSRFQFTLSYTYMNFQVSNGVVTSATGNSYGSSAVEIRYPTTPACDVRTENCVGFIGNYYFDTEYLTNPTNFTLYGDTGSTIYIPLKIGEDIYTPPISISNKVFMDALIRQLEPEYTINQSILENGNVKLDFTFTNYTSDNTYGFTITNRVSGEEYGITNPYDDIYPNIIPYGETYSIEIPYDTIINVSLSLYTQIEGTSLYDREVLYVDSYDINNVVFSDPQQPHFSIISQTQNNLIGKYNNTKTGDICGHIYNNNNVEWETNCNETLDIEFSLNGYVEVYVKRNNNIIYSRKINYIANQQNQPYIVWETNKQDFYSVINWSIKNYDNTMTYRYSKDNGNTFTTWASAIENNYINVYDNNTIIIEIANSDQSTIYDSKAINVINSISNLNQKNNTTNNFINKFTSIFSVNENILDNINQYWGIIKNSKLYLLIFIPFITSIICGIIYLIRRK